MVHSSATCKCLTTWPQITQVVEVSTCRPTFCIVHAYMYILMRESLNHRLTTRGKRLPDRTQLEFRPALTLQMIGDLAEKSGCYPPEIVD